MRKLVAPFSAWARMAFGLALLAGCAPPGPRALLEGERLIQRGEHRQAIEKLEEATRLLPRNAQAWNHLGLAYHGVSRFEEAVKAYQQALALERNLAAAHFNLGCLHLEQTNPPAALAAMTSYTGLRPNDPAGWIKLGTAQLRTRQIDAAEKSFNQALKLNGRSPEALNGAGIIQFHRRRYQDAYRQFNAASREQPDYAPALLNSAVVSQQHLTNRTLALQKYREFLAVRPAPANASAVAHVARQLELELRPQASPITTNPPLPLTALTNPSLSLTQGASKPAPSSTPGKPVAAPSTASSNGAFTIPTTPLTREPPSTSTPPVKVEVVQLSDDEPIRPARDLAVAAPASPSRPSATRSTSATEPAIKPESEKEKKAFVQRLNPKNWFRSKEKIGGPTSPATTEVAASRSPGADRSAGEPGSVSQRGTLKSAFARYAYRIPATGKAGNRSEAERLVAQGVQAQEQNRLNEAIESYRKATRADPSFFEAHYNLGVATFEAGDLPESLLAYEGALAADSISVKARFNFALALQKANYPLDAANELEKLLADHPDEARAHFSLANLYAQNLGLPQKARAHYVRVLELEPRHPQATAVRFWLEANR